MKRAAGLILNGVIVALVIAGCGGQKNPLVLPNQPPEVELFARRLDHSGTGPHAYRLQWVGRDPDGRIDHYLYALESPGENPRTAPWTATTEREHPLSFPARAAAPARVAITPIEPSVFTVQAVDGLGARSAPAEIAFFDGALAPRVEIVSPKPNPLVRLDVAPTLCVEWAGTAFDDDSSAERVTEYKYILLTSTTGVDVATALTNPDSVRRYYAARNWSGWVSKRGSASSTVLRGLTPDREYVFVITCFDEDGNYDPVFSLSSNMIHFRVTSSPSFILPRITVFNQFLHYQQVQGSVDTSRVINLEVPAGERLTFNWYGTLIPGRQITGYRWALDLVTPGADGGDDDDSDHGDQNGDRSRRDRDDDRRCVAIPRPGHWSRWCPTLTSITLGPFAGREVHRLYIEARAGSGCDGEGSSISLVVINFAVVGATLGRDLLIVDDTRLLLDRINPGTTCGDPANRPIGNWPTAAELDTFLYARGGAPWRCYPPGTMSTPGVFS
ncbi:MAG: hypothetical protein E6K72_10400, partial [Candidatus Eisenbacteria bacterium]